MDSSIKAGQAITVSLPADTPQYVLTYLDHLKNAGERTYNRKIGQLFVESVSQACSRQQPCLLIPFPEHLSEEQQDWFNHPYTRQLLAKWIFHMVLEHSPSSNLIKPPETTEVLSEPRAEYKSFEISTSYHNNLVGFFINDD